MANNAGTILLLGSNGQVGHELQRSLAPLGDLVALDVPSIDFSAPKSLREIVRRHAPQIIVNAAAYTAVDKAEAEPDLAFAVNAASPSVLAEEATVLGATLVHYSTDYVFDGRKAIPYVEGDSTNPLSVYGSSKLAGEAAVSTTPQHLIFRTSWVVGVHGHNFIKTILRLADEREALRIVDDQIGAPTSAALLARLTAAVLQQVGDRNGNNNSWGVYHAVAAGETSWHGLARHVIAYAAAKGVVLKTPPDAVAAISSAEYPTPARRPANSRLDMAKIRAAFAVDIPDWKTGVNHILDDILAKSST